MKDEEEKNSNFKVKFDANQFNDTSRVAEDNILFFQISVKNS